MRVALTVDTVWVGRGRPLGFSSGVSELGCFSGAHQALGPKPQEVSNPPKNSWVWVDLAGSLFVPLLFRLLCGNSKHIVLQVSSLFPGTVRGRKIEPMLTVTVGAGNNQVG